MLQENDRAHGLTVREIRFKRNASQYSIQKSLGVHQSRLSLIENGLVQPTDKEKRLIAEALGIDQSLIVCPQRNGTVGGLFFKC